MVRSDSSFWTSLLSASQQCGSRRNKAKNKSVTTQIHLQMAIYQLLMCCCFSISMQKINV